MDLIHVVEAWKHRRCSVCDEKATNEIELKTGDNSATLIAYCDKHTDQFGREVEEKLDFRINKKGKSS